MYSFTDTEDALIYATSTNTTGVGEAAITLRLRDVTTGITAVTGNLWTPTHSGEDPRHATWAGKSQWDVLTEYTYTGRRRGLVPQMYSRLDALASQIGVKLPETETERRQRIQMATSTRLAREEALRIRTAEISVIEDVRVKARLKAEDLLLSCLTEEQRARLKDQGSFRLVGSNGSTYEVKRGRQHNIYKLDAQGNRVEELCVHPWIHMPNSDTMLLQKISLETDENEMRRIANIWDVVSRRMISRSGQVAH